MHSIMANNTWILVDLSHGVKPISCTWIFKMKLKTDGMLYKYRARLVAKGLKQKKEFDYFDAFFQSQGSLVLDFLFP